MEILVVNTALANNIREGKTHRIPSATQVGGRLGVQLLNTHLLDLVRQQVIEPLEAYYRATDTEGDMLTIINAAGFTIDVEK